MTTPLPSADEERYSSERVGYTLQIPPTYNIPTNICTYVEQNNVPDNVQNNILETVPADGIDPLAQTKNVEDTEDISGSQKQVIQVDV